MHAGDTLVVPSLDRLSRSLQDLITTVSELRRRGVGFTSLHENLDTTTPGGRLVFHVFAALDVISSLKNDQLCDLGCEVADNVLEVAA
jgi:DNA invertase Pin-like site-specific DNA recombinase